MPEGSRPWSEAFTNPHHLFYSPLSLLNFTLIFSHNLGSFDEWRQGKKESKITYVIGS